MEMRDAAGAAGVVEWVLCLAGAVGALERADRAGDSAAGVACVCDFEEGRAGAARVAAVAGAADCRGDCGAVGCDDGAAQSGFFEVRDGERTVEPDFGQALAAGLSRVADI